MSDQITNSLLGQLLIASHAITPEDLREALRRQETTGQRLGEVLQEMGAVAPRQLDRALRAQSRLKGRADGDREFVLVIDDDPEVGAVVGDILQGAGYRVGVAQDESEALAALMALSQRRPAAIVLDLGLPKTGGVELLTVLRKMGDTQRLPVVVLTGRPDLGATLTERGLEISALLAKPVAARELLEVVEKAVQDGAAELAAATK